MGIIDTTSRGGINFGEEERESETAKRFLGGSLVILKSEANMEKCYL